MLLQVMMSLSGLLKYFGSKRVMLLFLAQAPLVWLSAMYAPVSVLEKDPVALVTIFIAAVAACAHVYSLVGYTVEASLSCKPWARWQLAGSDGGEARCPFARDAKPPSHRCPDCGSLVSEAAWCVRAKRSTSPPPKNTEFGPRRAPHRARCMGTRAAIVACMTCRCPR